MFVVWFMLCSSNLITSWIWVLTVDINFTDDFSAVWGSHIAFFSKTLVWMTWQRLFCLLPLTTRWMNSWKVSRKSLTERAMMSQLVDQIWFVKWFLNLTRRYYKQYQATNKTASSSCLTNCPYELYVWVLKNDGWWRLMVHNETHNMRSWQAWLGAQVHGDCSQRSVK